MIDHFKSTKQVVNSKEGTHVHKTPCDWGVLARMRFKTSSDGLEKSRRALDSRLNMFAICAFDDMFSLGFTLLCSCLEHLDEFTSNMWLHPMRQPHPPRPPRRLGCFFLAMTGDEAFRWSKPRDLGDKMHRILCQTWSIHHSSRRSSLEIHPPWA